MLHYLLVAAGGAVGAVTRHWVYNLRAFSGQDSAWATFVINAAGSLLIGVAYVVITEKASLPPEWRSLVTVGFIAAFTTYSTYSLDALLMLERGQIGAALLYLVGTMVVCVLAAWVGLALTRSVF